MHPCGLFVLAGVRGDDAPAGGLGEPAAGVVGAGCGVDAAGCAAGIVGADHGAGSAVFAGGHRVTHAAASGARSSPNQMSSPAA